MLPRLDHIKEDLCDQYTVSRSKGSGDAVDSEDNSSANTTLRVRNVSIIDRNVTIDMGLSFCIYVQHVDFYCKVKYTYTYIYIYDY